MFQCWTYSTPFRKGAKGMGLVNVMEHVTPFTSRGKGDLEWLHFPTSPLLLGDETRNSYEMISMSKLGWSTLDGAKTITVSVECIYCYYINKVFGCFSRLACEHGFQCDAKMAWQGSLHTSRLVTSQSRRC